MSTIKTKPAASLASKLMQGAATVVPLMIVALLILAVWQALVLVMDWPPAVLPSPKLVFEAMYSTRALLIRGMLTTGAAAATGLLAAIVVGTSLGLLFSQSARLRLALFPYMIFLQTVPIIAIAPLLIIWSGYQFRSVVIVTVIVALFPITNSVTTGLITLRKQWEDLFILYGASRYKKLLRLQIPNAIPYLVLGTKNSTGLAVIGAIVAEFFVGSGASYKGLGALMTKWQGAIKTPEVVAALFASTLLGLMLFAAVELISRTLLRRWLDKD